MSKKIYKHPKYGHGLAPIECIHKLTLPAHWTRGAVRRFELVCKKQGVFYDREGKTVTLAFASEEEKISNVNFFKAQLELNKVDFKEK